MLSRITAVLASTLLLTLLLVAPAHATFPGGNGRIAFSDGATNIFTINPDGSGESLLTGPPDQCGKSNPAWSADGTKIAFSKCGALAVINADGTGEHELACTCVNSDYPTWSPDGSRIAFVRFHLGPPYSVIHVINADGTGDTVIMSDGQPRNPDWSPDGTRIAFASQINGGIYTMKPDGSDVTKVPNTMPRDRQPSWSPDGRQLAFARVDLAAGLYDIYKINVDGTGITRLTTSTTTEAPSPAWSPDGQRIVFVTIGDPVHGSERKLTVMNADGTGQTQLSTTSAYDADWQPLPITPPAPGPQRSDYKTASQFCKAERAFIGERQFRQKYGTGPKSGANAHGRCVRRNR
jgi:Tol biopolymer transport system component